MWLQTPKMHRYLMALIITACLFGDFFPFLNIDLRVVILTPVRLLLVLVSIYCCAIWGQRICQGFFFSTWKEHKVEWVVFVFFVCWSISGIGWLVFGTTNSFAPTEVMGILVSCMFAFCMFTLNQTRDDIAFFLKVCVFYGVLLALLAMVEVVIGSFSPTSRYLYTLQERIEMGRTLFAPTSVFHNPNDFAAFILLCLSIVFYRILKAENTREFYYNLLLAAVMTTPTFLTNSTLFNLTSLLLVLLTAVGLLCIRRGNLRNRIRLTAIFVALTMIFGFGVAKIIRSTAVSLNKMYFTHKIELYYSTQSRPTPETEGVESDAPNKVPVTILPSRPTPEKEGVESDKTNKVPVTIPPLILEPTDVEIPDSLAHQIETAQYGRGTIHTRLWLIRAGWEYFCDAPLFGCGPGAFRDQMKAHPQFLEQTGGIVDPHFFYMELLSQYGGMLFLVYVVIYLCIGLRAFLMAIRELHEGCPGRGILCLFMLGAFAVAVIMPSSVIRHTALWMMFLAAVSAYSCWEITERTEKTE